MKISNYTVIVIFNKFKWDVFEVMAESKAHARQLAQLDFPYAKIGNISRT